MKHENYAVFEYDSYYFIVLKDDADVSLVRKIRQMELEQLQDELLAVKVAAAAKRNSTALSIRNLKKKE